MRRLLSVIEDATTSAADRAYGHRLAAVMLREIGDLDDAARHLEEAWRYTAMQGLPAVELAINCLLERATQVADADPTEAVRLIGLVRNWRPVARVVDYGVVYDMTAMLDGLRDRLGSEVVDAILAEASSQPLPDRPDWSTSPEARLAHAAGGNASPS